MTNWTKERIEQERKHIEAGGYSQHRIDYLDALTELSRLMDANAELTARAEHAEADARGHAMVSEARLDEIHRHLDRVDELTRKLAEAEHHLLVTKRCGFQFNYDDDAGWIMSGGGVEYVPSPRMCDTPPTCPITLHREVVN